MDLTKIKSIYFVGIKGVAMTALAILVKEIGISVTGSDIAEEFPTDATLKRFNIKYFIGFDPIHIKYKPDLVIYTGAHQGRKNIEVQTSIKIGIPILSHGEALGFFMKEKFQICVAGSHGKTTTSAMIAFSLIQLNEDPSFAIGCGEILGLHTSGHFGKSKYFVAEADEYITDPTGDRTPRFLWQTPQILVITNIDFDHPDAYKDITQVQEAFIHLTKKVTQGGHIIINLDDHASQEIINQISVPVVTYGMSKQANYQTKNIHFENNLTKFEVWQNNQKLSDFNIKAVGAHNAMNATSVIVALKLLGFSVENIKKVLALFSGTKRRFEYIGQKNDKLLYDDYAHHPTEIKATLKGIREFFPNKRIVVIFQPHTYSRTAKLLEEFGRSFNFADTVIITDIYVSAREKPILGISGKLLTDIVKKQNKQTVFIPNEELVLKYLSQETRANDLILTMGAGDIYSWIPKILNIL